MGRLMAIPAYENYYFEQIVKVAMLAGGDGGWLQQEATREYNQIQQAAYADSNKLYGYLGILYSCDNPCFDGRGRVVVSFAGIGRRSFSATSRLMAIICPPNYPNLNNGGVVNAAAGVAHRRGRTGKHLRHQLGKRRQHHGLH